MIREISLSGEYAKKTKRRPIHVWKYCRKARLPGISDVIKKEHIKTVKVFLDCVELDSDLYEIKKDRVHFKEKLMPSREIIEKSYLFGLFKTEKAVTKPKSYFLHVEVVFDYLEEAQYTYD